MQWYIKSTSKHLGTPANVVGLVIELVPRGRDGSRKRDQLVRTDVLSPWLEESSSDESSGAKTGQQAQSRTLAGPVGEKATASGRAPSKSLPKQGGQRKSNLSPPEMTEIPGGRKVWRGQRGTEHRRSE